LRRLCGYNPFTFKSPDKPRIVTHSLRLTLILLLCCGLAACGQKGPLQRPDQSTFAVSVR
jgi:hypothetical protein